MYGPFLFTSSASPYACEDASRASFLSSGAPWPRRTRAREPPRWTGEGWDGGPLVWPLPDQEEGIRTDSACSDIWIVASSHWTGKQRVHSYRTSLRLSRMLFFYTGRRINSYGTGEVIWDQYAVNTSQSVAWVTHIKVLALLWKGTRNVVMKMSGSFKIQLCSRPGLLLIPK